MNTVHEALKPAHTYSIRAELISQLARPRLPELGLGNTLDPLEALKTYLNNREDLRDLVGDMLEAAQSLLNRSEEIWIEVGDEEIAEKETVAASSPNPSKRQLRLL